MHQDSVRDIGVKLQRAAQLGAELEDLCINYLWSDPCTVTVRPRSGESAYDVTAHVKAPPAIISAVFGDVLHNYRSALDYLARQLVIANGRSPIDGGPGSTSFPIRDNRGKTAVDIRPGIASAARIELDLLQPYQHGAEASTHPLWQLQDLNNRDKHRLLNLTALSEAGNVVVAPADGVSLTITPEMRTYSVRVVPGVDQILRVHPDDVLPEASLRGSWTSTVVLAEATESRYSQLMGIWRRIGIHLTDVVIPALAKFL